MVRRVSNCWNDYFASIIETDKRCIIIFTVNGLKNDNLYACDFHLNFYYMDFEQKIIWGSDPHLMVGLGKIHFWIHYCNNTPNENWDFSVVWKLEIFLMQNFKRNFNRVDGYCIKTAKRPSCKYMNKNLCHSKILFSEFFLLVLKHVIPCN